VLLSILDDPALSAGRAGQVIIADKHYYGREFEAALAEGGFCLLRPARQGEPARPGTRFFKPLRQVVESVNDTFKGQPGPRTTRRPYPSRGHRPHPPAHPRPDHRHLAQRPHQTAHQALTGGLRPLTSGFRGPTVRRWCGL